MRIPTREQHWYRMEGNICKPCYELSKASGQGMKSPTLTDAKKLGLLPSVTNILSVLDKPAIDNWRVGQAIISSLTLPKKEGEAPDDFAARVVLDMDNVSEVAREFGTKIHDEAINWLQTGEKGPLWPFLDGLPKALDGYSFTTLEEVVHSPAMGVAGRLDYSGKHSNNNAIIDFKSQGVRGGKPVFYPEWGLQLAAYAACKFGYPDRFCELVSVIIPSGEPGPIAVKVWDDGPFLLSMFEHCLELWTWAKDYDPRG
jgi:hypothetical protein